MMRYFFSFLFCVVAGLAYGQRQGVLATSEFRITGDIAKERTVIIADIMKYPQVELGDISIKNHRGEEKVKARHVKGVLLMQLLDSAGGIQAEKPKELSEYYFVFTASDGYKNVYSWNEIYNSPVGKQLYIVTGQDGKDIKDMDGRIQVLSLGDYNTGRRYLKGLAVVEVRRAR
ncbi:MAG: molybdopterin-binding protein [Bacteroidetes bacterium]|nr:molybdopterin-binding protein [Bacteroidota bacterium]